MSISQSSDTEKRPSKLWWLFATNILAVCLFIQLPIAWIVQKVAPNPPYIQRISGSLWQGTVIWQLPASKKGTGLSGNVHWQFKPVRIFLGKLSADIEVHTGKSVLKGEISTGFKSTEINHVSGRIYKDTLNHIVNWQLPNTPIQAKDINIKINKEKGFESAKGEVIWVGGQVGYPKAGQIEQINLPSLKAKLGTKNKGAGNVLHAHVVDQDNKNLGDFYLDKQGMIDISLTQRLLENMPSYSGTAPKDTPVISLRQSIQSVGN